MKIFFDIETIRDYIPTQEKQDKYGDKLSFMPEFNKILTITVWTITTEWIAIKNLEWDEKEQIERFFKAIEWNEIVWFNIKQFDIPFIIKRAIAKKLKIPNCLKFYWKKSREMENIIDLLEIYRCWSFGTFWNLDLACEFLGIKSPKNWIDWSQVQKFYDEWKTQEILDYCKFDVRRTIELYQEFLKYNLI